MTCRLVNFKVPGRQNSTWCRNNLGVDNDYFNNPTVLSEDFSDNNVLEWFNSWILEARYKLIISMLDHIRL